MSIAFVNAADLGNNGGGASGYTVAYTVGSGQNRLLVVVFEGDTATDDITSVTYAGAGMTLACKIPTNRWLYFYFLLNPASGAHNVVISSSSSKFIIACAADYENVQQSGQPDATATNSKGATLPNTLASTITTIAQNAWAIMGSGGFKASAPPVAGTGATRRTFDATFGAAGIFDSNADLAPGLDSMTWLYTANDAGVQQGSVLASFAPFLAIPVITSLLTASGNQNVPFSYQITATNSPTSFSASGLPTGLSVNANTGLISGTPLQFGVFSVTLGATNAGGTGNATLTLTIVQAPKLDPWLIPGPQHQDFWQNHDFPEIS